MSGDKMKLKIEKEYKRHFVLANNLIEDVEQSYNRLVKTEVMDQPVQGMDEIPQKQKQHPTDWSSDEDSDIEQQVDNNGRDEENFLRGFNKTPQINYQDRKQYNKDRKARKLRRFRKFLTPKNAVTALYELQGRGNFELSLNSNCQQTRAEITINNVKYEATAANKTLAKAKVSEKALREVFLAQLKRLKQKQQQQQQQQLGADLNTIPEAKMNSAQVKVEAEEMECIDLDDLPIEHFASFALYKMFHEWEAQESTMPINKMLCEKWAAQAPAHKRTSNLPKITKGVAELPPNATSHHPTSLLAYMRPHITFQDLGMLADRQSQDFIVGLMCDGHHFTGQGRSKKLARKAAAIDACKKLFGVVFDESVSNVSTVAPVPVQIDSMKDEA